MTLTPEVLQERLANTEARFNAARIRKDRAQAQVDELEAECHKLQGEFRAVQAMLDEIKKTDATPAPQVKVEGESKEAGNGRTK